MRKRIPLCTTQCAIMREFYALPPLRVVFAKAERDAIRDKAKKGTIAAKMFFKGLDYGAVAAHYAADLG